MPRERGWAKQVWLNVLLDTPAPLQCYSLLQVEANCSALCYPGSRCRFLQPSLDHNRNKLVRHLVLHLSSCFYCLQNAGEVCPEASEGSVVDENEASESQDPRRIWAQRCNTWIFLEWHLPQIMIQIYTNMISMYKPQKLFCKAVKGCQPTCTNISMVMLCPLVFANGLLCNFVLW